MANWSSVDVEHDKGVKVISHERVEDTNPEIFHERGDVFFKAGKYAEAENEYIRAYQLSGKNDIYYKVLIKFYAAIRSPKARKMLKKYVWTKWRFLIWFIIVILFGISYMQNDGIWAFIRDDIPPAWREKSFILMPFWCLGLLWLFSYGGIGRSIKYKVIVFFCLSYVSILFGNTIMQSASATEMVVNGYAYIGKLFGVVFVVDGINTIRKTKNMQPIIATLLVVFFFFFICVFL